MAKRENPLLENLKSGKPSIGLADQQFRQGALCAHIEVNYARGKAEMTKWGKVIRDAGIRTN